MIVVITTNLQRKAKNFCLQEFQIQTKNLNSILRTSKKNTNRIIQNLKKKKSSLVHFSTSFRNCRYNGSNVRLRYFLRVTIQRSTFSTNIVEEKDLWVMVYPEPPVINDTIKMEVGIEDCLHIEFEYGKSKYHLKVLRSVFIHSFILFFF